MGFLAFLGIAALVAVACHRWIRSFFLALLISGPVAACVFQVVVTIQLGHRDKFFLIALFTTTLVGWAVSLFVGLILRYVPFDPVSDDGGASDPQAPSQTHEEQSPANSRRK